MHKVSLIKNCYVLQINTRLLCVQLYIFSKRVNSSGAIIGMISGLLFTSSYIIFFKFISPDLNFSENWFLGISPEGIGVVGMIINFTLAVLISFFTKPPPNHIIRLIDNVRTPE